MKYEYSEGNRIKQPHNYMYSRFQGEPFLDEYKNTRINTIENLLGTFQKKYGNISPNSMDKSTRTECCEVLHVISRYMDAIDDAFLSDIQSKMQTFVQNDDAGINAVSLFNGVGTVETGSTLAANTLDNWFVKLEKEESLHTRDFLKESLFLLLHCESEDVKRMSSFLSELAKKYEVFKRIFTVYDSSLRKKGDESDDLNCYILLSLNFSLLYMRTKSLKFLNVLLKVNDAICSVQPSIHGIQNLLFACISLKIELAAFQKLGRP